MAEFNLVMPFEPAGDQPEAIRQLTEGVLRGDRHQVLPGATGPATSSSSSPGRRRSPWPGVPWSAAATVPWRLIP